MSNTKPSKKELEKLYFGQNKSTWEISQIYNRSQTQVRRWFIELGIRARNYAEASKITRNGFKEGKKHINWKGSKVSYSALHTWIIRHKGYPQKCEICGTTEPRKYEWANKDHKYQRNLDDFIRLCASCHRKYDRLNNRET
jgi:hypothetical protein